MVMTTIKIKQIRSRIGCPKKQKRILDALGLRKIGRVVEHEANPAILGMVEKVKHLVEIAYAEANPIKRKIKRDKIRKMQKIVKRLSRLDLSKRPKYIIKNELKKVNCLPFMLTTFAKGKEIERAVPNTDEEPLFSDTNRISYKPQEYNTDYQRASTPDNTMFYGSVIPEKISEDEISYARMIGAAETSELIRDANAPDGEQLITFGKWTVKEDLNLITIVNPITDYKIQFIKELVSDYRKRLEELPDKLNNESQLFLKFITKEFSKKVNKGENFNYMISANFTELILKNPNIDGIIYPSVQAGKEGLCVAIRPESMYKLELTKVLQCKIIRNGKLVLLDNVKYCMRINHDGTFDLLDIPK
jgi:ribosomal protein L30